MHPFKIADSYVNNLQVDFAGEVFHDVIKHALNKAEYSCASHAANSGF